MTALLVSAGTAVLLLALAFGLLLTLLPRPRRFGFDVEPATAVRPSSAAPSGGQPPQAAIRP